MGTYSPYLFKLKEQNRPLNSQNVADALQKYNLKKTAVQKALDSLSDSGQISFKEYGKQKIYIARQDQFNIPNSEELEQMKKENSKLQEELEKQNKAIGEVEAEIRALQSNLTLEQIRIKETKLKAEVKEMEERLAKLSEGTALVNPEDRKAVEEIQDYWDWLKYTLWTSCTRHRLRYQSPETARIKRLKHCFDRYVNC
ncbi:hypothetical protein QJS04_geneDACA020438 [Acorus gramineus]|uniref:Homologous-pairing protein 2 winged helix domain-containing protein n=1 Tax=Acorus gramineus TaxID=55184 RepID=A0AAV9BXP5_ACOGR|nr:hypothetical protein QJS04_geneDACA020438 [Acorus gramineus]